MELAATAERQRPIAPGDSPTRSFAGDAFRRTPTAATDTPRVLVVTLSEGDERQWADLVRRLSTPSEPPTPPLDEGRLSELVNHNRRMWQARMFFYLFGVGVGIEATIGALMEGWPLILAIIPGGVVVACSLRGIACHARLGLIADERRTGQRRTEPPGGQL